MKQMDTILKDIRIFTCRLYFHLYGIGIILLYLTAKFSFADELEMSFTSKGNLHIQADCYQFAADDGKTRLEIAYSFLLSQFDEEKFKNDSLFLNINLQITDLQQKPLFKISEQKKFHLNPNNGNDNNLFIDLKKYILIPGEIIIKLNVSDANNYYQGIIDKNLNVRDFSTELSLSDPVFVAFLLVCLCFVSPCFAKKKDKDKSMDTDGL